MKPPAVCGEVESPLLSEVTCNGLNLCLMRLVLLHGGLEDLHLCADAVVCTDMQGSAPSEHGVRTPAKMAHGPARVARLCHCCNSATPWGSPASCSMLCMALPLARRDLRIASTVSGDSGTGLPLL